MNTYQGVFYLYINSRLAVSTDGEGDSYPNLIKHQQKLLTLLSKEVNKVVKEIMKNADGYNERIARDLAYQHRLGKIKRSVYWSIFADEKKRFKKVLTQKDFETLAKIVEQSKEENTLTPIKFMTSGYFFKCCALGYDANQYFKGKEGFSAKEKYARMADGRDCALKELKQNSIDEFTKWYSHERNCGGHPWEICRGGNSTHISLFISQVNGGWMLRLAGSSAGRVVETVKIAIALYEKNIPFILDRATEIYNMVRGEDFIGIVPEGITPRYCHSLFPNTDRIIDFMNLDFEKRDAVVKKADWFPEEEVKSLKKKK